MYITQGCCYLSSCLVPLYFMSLSLYPTIPDSESDLCLSKLIWAELYFIIQLNSINDKLPNISLSYHFPRVFFLSDLDVVQVSEINWIPDVPTHNFKVPILQNVPLSRWYSLLSQSVWQLWESKPPAHISYIAAIHPAWVNNWMVLACLFSCPILPIKGPQYICCCCCMRFPVNFEPHIFAGFPFVFHEFSFVINAKKPQIVCKYHISSIQRGKLLIHKCHGWFKENLRRKLIGLIFFANFSCFSTFTRRHERMRFLCKKLCLKVGLYYMKLVLRCPKF